MQEIKTNRLGIRVTDSELRRLEVIKERMGLPSMTNTTLGHDLLVMGIAMMENQRRSTRSRRKTARPVGGKRKPLKKVAGSRPLLNEEAVDV